MSVDDKLLRARMRREDLQDELRTVEEQIAAVRERGRDTMGILSREDNAQLHKLISDQERLQQDLSEARSEERFQRKLAEQPRPSLTEWKAKREREHGRDREDVERSREPDLERER